MTKNEGGGLETIADIVETQDDEGNDTTNWKELAQAVHKLGKSWEGVAKRNHSDFEKLKLDPRLSAALTPPEQKPAPEKTGFDYGELAYLEAKEVPEEDHDFLFGEAKTTGKELRQLLSFDYVKEALRKNKEARTTKEALPSGSKRSAPPARDTADYWYAKVKSGDIEFGAIPDPKIRHEIRRRKEKESGGSNTGGLVR